MIKTFCATVAGSLFALAMPLAVAEPTSSSSPMW